ncbi:MAG: non-canonical purine NTP diphosphatase [Salinivirgaceae bacterium]|nr:non-canonical purine NTP diphosphatase [Salinivirgaceae bacterium]MBO7433004.1 non-canonical purine NTP diphosphatase [Salinivirgaceae bacterium]MBO7594527.1 non-canonical purine NTP diphosphatase [Salinivirgaceae bacterium]MBR5166727.1 non-canonical purine NTP diphosphatase [Salinivirgaceae bacterium]
MNKLIFATHNDHKFGEVKKLIGDLYDLVDLDDIGITDDIPETGDTLESNARIKARYVKEHCGNSVFADDTGLEVEILNGQPGVYTARFAGPECDSEKNMEKLLRVMEGEENRRAQFRTVICLIIGDNEYLFEGVVKGRIATKTSGTGGFGYDPVFIPDGYDKTFAEMPSELKNQISHRAIAVERFATFLKELGN